MSVNLIEVKGYDYLPCAAEFFRIKGKKAHLEDFGSYEYGDYDKCEYEDICRWGCFEKYFVAISYERNRDIAEKYDLSREEYDEVCSELENEFAIGTCGLCV